MNATTNACIHPHPYTHQIEGYSNTRYSDIRRALAAATLSFALMFGGGGNMPANAVSGGVADFVNIAGQDLSGQKVCPCLRACTNTI